MIETLRAAGTPQPAGFRPIQCQSFYLRALSTNVGVLYLGPRVSTQAPVRGMQAVAYEFESPLASVQRGIALPRGESIVLPAWPPLLSLDSWEVDGTTTGDKWYVLPLASAVSFQTVL